MPWASRRIDRLSHQFLVPRYASQGGGHHRGLGGHPAARDGIPACASRSGRHRLFRRGRRVSPASSTTGRLAEVRAKYALPDRFLLYAGAIYPPKNFTRLIRAYAAVGPAAAFPSWWPGGENRFLSEHELREPEALGIAEWVRWPGWVEQEDLAGFYALADALLLPSLFESCGLPVLEAMAAGCPVVTADRYGTKELAEGAAVLVDPESVDSIADGIRQVLDDTTRRAQLIAAGKARSAGFQWRRCAAETLSVLERVRQSGGWFGGTRFSGQPPRPAPDAAGAHRSTMSRASISPAAEPGPRAEAVRVVINARHLTGPRTGIEVYMEQLLGALSRTGQVEITALSWAPLNLGLPGVREVMPGSASRGGRIRGPPPGSSGSISGTRYAQLPIRKACWCTAWMVSCRTPSAPATDAL